MVNALRCLQIVCLLAMSTLTALAQTPISGRVTGEQNDGIPGVTVSIKGTTRGTTTDATGTFKLNASSNETLVFSYVGYMTQEALVGSKTDFSIKLVPDTRSLEEIVVVGYGTVKKSDLTGSVSTIKARSHQRNAGGFGRSGHSGAGGGRAGNAEFGRTGRGNIHPGARGQLHQQR